MKKADIPVIDLHNDLLSFFTFKPGRSIDDPLSRSSITQLREGSIKLQTLAIFTTTGEKSVEEARDQIDCYRKLLNEHPLAFAACRFPFDAQGPIKVLPAFENASSFASEDEPLRNAIERLENYIRSIGPFFYITLTWNDENRFGGGNMTTVGLKEDGKRLLEWMDGKRIAVDMSHTSDKFAYEMIDFIDKNGLDIPIIASHSNFRAISNYPRNLPDDLAKEIVRRKGLIGLNFFAPFIHDTDPSAILRHVEYGLSLGAENALSFGADFFCDTDFPSLMNKYQRTVAYYPGLDNSSVYPGLLGLFAQKIGLQEEQLLNIASRNALRFLDRIQIFRG